MPKKPAVFMPANPSLANLQAEDLFPFVDEPRSVAVGVTVRVPAGRFKNAIVLKETTQLSSAVERKTYAPGVGVSSCGENGVPAAGRIDVSALRRRAERSRSIEEDISDF